MQSSSQSSLNDRMKSFILEENQIQNFTNTDQKSILNLPYNNTLTNIQTAPKISTPYINELQQTYNLQSRTYTDNKGDNKGEKEQAMTVKEVVIIRDDVMRISHKDIKGGPEIQKGPLIHK